MKKKVIKKDESVAGRKANILILATLNGEWSFEEQQTKFKCQDDQGAHDDVYGRNV